MKKYFYSFLFLYSFFYSKAQDTGEIRDATIIIEKNKNISLPAAPRNFEKIHSNNQNSSEIQIPFHLTTIQPFLRPMDFELKALKLQTNPLEKYYGNMLKIGFGNYYSPLFDAYFYNKRHEKFSYGGNVQHLSFGTGPIGGKNSAEGNTKIHIEGKIIQKKYSIAGNIKYQHQYFHYYGYNPDGSLDADSTFQNYHKTSGNILVNNDTDSSFFLKYNAKISLQNQISREKTWKTISTQKYNYQKNFQILLPQNFPSQQIGCSILIFKSLKGIGIIYPHKYFIKKEKFLLSAGMNIAIQSDTLNKHISAYPLIIGTYKLHPLAHIYTRIYGESELITWKNLTDINPYLSKNPSLVWNNNNKTFAWELEIQGNYKIFSYALGYSLHNYNTYGFFVPSFEDSSQYNIVYETKKFTSNNFFTKMYFFHKSGLKASFKGEYFIYSTSLLEKPLHLPEYRAELELSYLFYNKIDVTLSACFMGGILGYNVSKKQIKPLNAFADISLHIQYLFSKKISAFLSFNNMLSSDYQILTNYPVRQLAFKIGATYSF